MKKCISILLLLMVPFTGLGQEWIMPVQQGLAQSDQDVKFTGIVNGGPDFGGLVGVGGTNILIDEILLDPTANLTIGNTATVTWGVYPLFSDIRVTTGNRVEVYGRYSDKQEMTDEWSGVGDHWISLTTGHYLKEVVMQNDWQTTAWEDVTLLPEPMFPDGAVAIDPYVYALDDRNVYYRFHSIPLSWNTTNGPPVDGTPGEIATDGEYIWQLGNRSASYYTSPLMDGSLQPWQSTTPSPCGHYEVGPWSFITVNGYLFMVGGYHIMGLGSVLPSVRCITINSDGTLGTGDVSSWESTKSLPEGRGRARLAVWGDHLYVLGGEGEGEENYDGVLENTRTVYRGHVESDASISTWHKEPNLPKALSDFAVVAVDKALYVIGGQDDGVYSSRVYRAEINDDGSLGDWKDVEHLQLPNGLYGHAAVYAGRHIIALGGHELGAVTDSVRRAVPTYHLREINERIASDPSGIVGRRLFIRAMPLATWDPTFGTGDYLKFAEFVFHLKHIFEALVGVPSLVALGQAWAILHIVESLVDSRVQVYVGVDLPHAGHALAGADLPLGGTPQDGEPYIMHGTVVSATYDGLLQSHTLYYFDLETSDDFVHDAPSSSNPRFPVPTDATWRPLPQVVSSYTEGQAYTTIGYVSLRGTDYLGDYIVFQAEGSAGEPLNVRVPHGTPLPEKGSIVLATGIADTFLVYYANPPYLSAGLSSTANDILCLSDRLNGCPTSVVEGSVDFSRLQTLVVETGSPVDVHLYDGDGRHTGAVYDGAGNAIGIETQIPDSYYFPGAGDDPEAILVDVLHGSDYEIHVRGTSAGTYSLGQMIVPVEGTKPFTHVVSSIPIAFGQVNTHEVEGLPVPPASVVVTQVGSSQIEISWAASPDSSVVGYNVYLAKGTLMTGTLQRANAVPVSGTSFAVTSFPGGADYQTGVTAVTTTGLESGFAEWVPFHATGNTFLPIVLRNYSPGTEPTSHPPNMPSNPLPPDGATNQSVNADLSWVGGDPDGDSVTYDVYFEANDSTPDNLACNGATTAYCDPGTLSQGTHYFWQVVARDSHGATTTGVVWDFTTEDARGWREVGTGSATGGGISDNGGNSMAPSMAIAADGTPYVAWYDYSGGDTEIYVRRWNGSSWEEVGAGSATGGGISDDSGDSYGPSIAIAPDGTPYVAWYDYSGEPYEIYIRRWNGGGWEEVGTGSATGGGISNNDGDSIGPSVAIAPDGTPYITWYDKSSGYTAEIFVRRWNGRSWEEVGAGSATSGGISNNSGSSEIPSMTIAPDGTPYVVWQDYSGGGYTPEIYVRRWNGSNWEEVGAGSATGGGISNNSGSSYGPSVAIAPDGTPYVAWHDYSGGGGEIYVRRWNGSNWEEVGTGSATGGGISGNGGNSMVSSMAIAPDGTPYVAWYDYSDGDTEIYVRRWNGSSWEEVGAGSATGGGISDNSDSSQCPSLASAPDGTPYVAWEDNSGHYTRTSEIYVRRWVE